jgi:hypothetical protein
MSEKLLLVVSEISEALEELRDGHTLTEVYYKAVPYGLDFKKPEGFPVEIADAIIRLLDIGYACGIDLDKIVNQKIVFNASRPVKHGRMF